MSNLIYGKLCEVGFCPDDAIEVIKALKTIVCIHGRSWRDELFGQYWFRATYPCLTERQGELMQTLRNHPKGFSLIREISWMKIKAESLPKYTHYLSCREQTSRASAEEFRKFVRVASGILVKWYERHSAAADSCLDLSLEEDAHSPSEVEHNNCILRILRSDMSHAEKVVRLNSLWMFLNCVLLHSVTSESIYVSKGDELDCCFCKTRNVQPFDALAVAIFAAAQSCSYQWIFTSDGADAMLTEGWKLADSVCRSLKIQCV